jgi:hypothetical protein
MKLPDLEAAGLTEEAVSWGSSSADALVLESEECLLTNENIDCADLLVLALAAGGADVMGKSTSVVIFSLVSLAVPRVQASLLANRVSLAAAGAASCGLTRGTVSTGSPSVELFEIIKRKLITYPRKRIAGDLSVAKAFQRCSSQHRKQ